MPKRSIRRSMLAQRKSLSPEEVSSASLRIQNTFLGTDNYRSARSILLYSPIHQEVDTELIARCALSSGKKVSFPRVVGEELFFCTVQDPSSLKKGAFGILEPCASGEIFAPEEADVLVVPGVAFDLNGHRIGYGKGYYDKTLHRLEGHGKLVGLCYDFQLIDEILNESHDVKMDLIITEKRIVYPLTSSITNSYRSDAALKS
ncbi:MAG: 5-formyltetrahydrofolate cyclo-ligase [Deltaproteobacteria bacterium]|nr:5-formyltetrahydrofolate cyclo-ligase [Deltaproteobacteria bacterium]